MRISDWSSDVCSSDLVDPARPRRRARSARRAGAGGAARGDTGAGPCPRADRVKTVTILGATGSVGTSTLDLIERAPERFEVLALTANRDAAGLAAAAIRTRAKRAVDRKSTRLNSSH